MSDIDLKDRTRHGGPYDRGSADSYYGRPMDPHYYVLDTYSSEMVPLKGGDEGFDEYMEGYRENTEAGNFKDWG